jgi:hypothetical protein
MTIKDSEGNQIGTFGGSDVPLQLGLVDVDWTCWTTYTGIPSSNTTWGSYEYYLIPTGYENYVIENRIPVYKGKYSSYSTENSGYFISPITIELSGVTEVTLNEFTLNGLYATIKIGNTEKTTRSIKYSYDGDLDQLYGITCTNSGQMILNSPQIAKSTVSNSSINNSSINACDINTCTIDTSCLYVDTSNMPLSASVPGSMGINVYANGIVLKGGDMAILIPDKGIKKWSKDSEGSYG